MVERWRAAPTWAAVTSYRDGLGHLFVFSTAAFATLRNLQADKAVWKVVDGAPADQVGRIAVEWDRPTDIDTWDDYLAVGAALDVAIERP